MKMLNFLSNNVFGFVLSVLAIALIATEPAYAGLAALEKSTDALDQIKTWLHGFVVVGSLVYITYLVVMAIAEKKAWSDVMMGLGYCAIAGGVVMGGTWATELWL